jgi:hypothetical protein
MRLYLDDDTASAVLVRLLRQAGHDVELPVEVDLRAADDAVHLVQAIRGGRILLSMNHDHFEALHTLVLTAHGHHPGILIIRRDNDARDLTPGGIVVAIRNLEAARLPLQDTFTILNPWR